MALAVLGVVTEGPMHPYEMASVLRARGKDEDMPMKWGSLYTVVQNLEKHGLIDAVERSRQGARPERTVYRITAAGRSELEDWVRELVSTPVPEQPRFRAGLSMLAALAPDEVADLLRERLRLLNREVGRRREHVEQSATEVPRLFLIEVEYAIALLEAEAAWVRSLLAEIESGLFPGIEEWKAMLEQASSVGGDAGKGL